MHKKLEGWELAAHKLTKPYYFDPNANPPRVIRRRLMVALRGRLGAYTYNAWFANGDDADAWETKMLALTAREGVE